ncbi:4-coumarate--CoA ligase 1-like [Sitophilus oryzae]|uniref:4-coumarate--CoA ligase 1-like n=1 Tax=Sitophilus oryzae TaxID=7048 RepID=A0A6J2XQW2_SITOR|nr:4-coumarate--CoA ligase 1-like [Sitophilus oryzae]
MGIENLPDDVSLDENNVLSCSGEYEVTTRGIGYEFFNSIKKNRRRVAQYIAETEEIDTYESLLKRSVRTALHLKERNLTEDDVVCLCSYNQIHSCVPFLACMFLGIKVASLDPSFTHADASHLIKLVKPKIMFIVPEVLEMMMLAVEEAEINCELVLYGDDVDTNTSTPFNDFLEPHDDEDIFTPVEIDDPTETIVIFFSSGTTGLPKGICSSHKSIYHQGNLTNYAGIINSNSIIVLFSTLYWVSAVLHLSGTILCGAARLICRSFDPNDLWIYLDKYKVTYCFLAPIQGYQMIAAGRPDDIDTSSLTGLVTGGALFFSNKLSELRDLLPGAFVFQAFGMTEVSGLSTIFNLNKTKDRLLLHYRPASCGRPVPGFNYKIVDPENDTNCGPNERGELRIQSEFILNGYYNQDSSDAYDSDGWLRTGDIAYYDEDMCFYIVGRTKEMLKYRSWHVPPATLENVLEDHPAIKQSIVIGIPDEVDGDHPMALIILNESYQEEVSEEEIQEFVAERVNDTHKLRGGVKFLDSFPLTPTGKVKRKELKEMVVDGVI